MDDSSDESWLGIPGWEDLYSVSDLGRVWSVRKQGLLKPLLTSGGYYRVILCRSGKRTNRKIAALVMAAFAGPRPAGLLIRHMDGVPTNDQRTNLCYGTDSENVLDQVRHGSHNNSSKEKCIHGHDFTPENTYMWRGKRQCRSCQRNKMRRRRANARAASRGTRDV